MKKDARSERWIHTPHDIKRVFKEGKREEGTYCRFVYGPNSLSCCRFGILLSKRIGKATRRNHLKRVFREILRTQKNIVSPCIDLLLLPAPQAVMAPYKNLRDTLITDIKRLSP